MKNILGVLFISLFLFSIKVEASDNNSIWIGNIRISIGMTKNNVINNLSENYEVIKGNTSTNDPTWENWSIYKKTDKINAEDYVAGLAFQKDKVSWVGKNWGGFRGREVAFFGEEFVKVLSKFSKDEKNNINIQLHEENEPGFSLKSICLSSGNHNITIIVTKEGINLQEDLLK